MESKWADYVITGVRYNPEETHIEALAVSEDLGASLALPIRFKRQDVVTLIDLGKTFVTAPPSGSNEGKLKRGAKVHIFPTKTGRYLRTDDNNKASDNLGELPRIT